MQSESISVQATPQFTGQFAPLETKRRADPAQRTTEAGATFPPLEQVTKPNLTTAELAYYLNRAPQTLRGWACRSGTGPIKPKRIGGILAWDTKQAKALAGVTV